VIQHAVQLQVLGGGQISIQTGILKNDAELLANFVRLLRGVQSVQLQAAAGGRQERGQHLDGGGFPCAIGPEECEDFALGDFK
jgi:hypothetical protein